MSLKLYVRTRRNDNESWDSSENLNQAPVNVRTFLASPGNHAQRSILPCRRFDVPLSHKGRLPKSPPSHQGPPSPPISTQLPSSHRIAPYRPCPTTTTRNKHLTARRPRLLEPKTSNSFHLPTLPASRGRPHSNRPTASVLSPVGSMAPVRRASTRGLPVALACRAVWASRAV